MGWAGFKPYKMCFLNTRRVFSGIVQNRISKKPDTKSKSNVIETSRLLETLKFYVSVYNSITLRRSTTSSGALWWFVSINQPKWKMKFNVNVEVLDYVWVVFLSRILCEWTHDVRLRWCTPMCGRIPVSPQSIFSWYFTLIRIQHVLRKYLSVWISRELQIIFYGTSYWRLYWMYSILR